MVAASKFQAIFEAIDRMSQPIRAISERTSTLTKAFSEASVSERSLFSRASAVKAQEFRQKVDESQKAIKELEQAQKRLAQFSALEQRTAGLKAKYEEARREATRLGQEISKIQEPTQRQINAFEMARERTQKLKAAYDESLQKQAEMRRSFDGLGLNIKNIDESTRRLNFRMQEQKKALDQNKKAVEDVGAAFQKLNDAVAKRDGFFERAANLSLISDTLTQVGQKMTGLVAAPIRTAVSIEQMESKLEAMALSDIKNTEERKRQLGDLSALAGKLGKETSFSKSQVLEGMIELAQAGFDKEKIQASIGGLLDVAKAGDVTIKEAAKITAGVLSQFEDQNITIQKAGDVIAAVATGANTDVRSMVDTFKYGGGLAAQMGMKLGEFGAAVHAMSKDMIVGSDVGTTLSAVIGNLEVPSDKAKKRFEELGLSLEGMTTFEKIKEVADAVKDLDKEAKAATLKDIFDDTAIKGFLSIQRMQKQVGKDGVTEFDRLAKKYEEVNGTAKEMAAIMGDNTAQSLETLGGAVQTLSENIGRRLSPIIRFMADILARVVDVVDTVINALGPFSTIIISLVGIIGALVTASGALIAAWISWKGTMLTLRIGLLIMQSSIIPGLVTAFGFLKTALLTTIFTTKALKIALVTTGIGAILVGIGFAAAWIWENWDKIKAGFFDLWNSIKGPLNTFWETLQSIAQIFAAGFPASAIKGPTPPSQQLTATYRAVGADPMKSSAAAVGGQKGAGVVIQQNISGVSEDWVRSVADKHSKNMKREIEARKRGAQYDGES
jgi:TP901 family phage tail tape measure protein